MGTKVKYNGKTYEVLETAGETIRIKSGDEEFCILRKDVEPVKCTKRKDGKE